MDNRRGERHEFTNAVMCIDKDQHPVAQYHLLNTERDLRVKFSPTNVLLDPKTMMQILNVCSICRRPTEKLQTNRSTFHGF